MATITPDNLWEALKKICCADPEKAVRIVQLTKKDLAKAMKILQKGETK